MRSLWIPLATLLLATGCMQYPRYGAQPYPYPYANPQAPQAQPADPQIPPGKMLVQDVRTGRLILVDDPDAKLRQQPEVQPYEPAPAPRDARVPRPPAPALPRPGFPHLDAPRPARPGFDVSLGVWAANIGGSVYGSADWGLDEAMLDDDLGLEDGSAVTLDFAIRFPRGPKFRLGIMSISADGVVPADRAVYPAVFPAPTGDIETEVGVLVVDLAFCPLIREARWGDIQLETGFRYARSSVAIGGESERFSEGVMASLAGALSFALSQDLFYGDVSLGVGLGPDSGYFEFGTGVELRPSPNFRLRLGYKFLAVVLVDRAEEWDERSLALSSGGPGLELGLRF